MTNSEARPVESIWSLAAFWLVAFAAAGLFAAVLLAPKWEQREFLDTRVRTLASECQRLEDANHRLDRVLAALKHDPEFNSDIARYELDYVMPGEQRLPAPIGPPPRPKPPETEPRLPDSLVPLVRLFAHDSLVRQTTLLTAAVFAIVGLAFFNASREPTQNSTKDRVNVARRRAERV